MRWTRNDSLAYETFSKAADDLKEWDAERQLAKAYGLKPEERYVTGYDVGDDPTGVQSTSYRLGGVSQDKPFTQDQIDRARMEEVANTYGRLGRPGEALKMRAAGVQLDAARQGLRKGEFEIAAAEDADRERRAVNDAFSVFQKARKGDKDALGQLLQLGASAYNQNPAGTEYDDGSSVHYDADGQQLYHMDGSGAVRTLRLNELDKGKLDSLLEHGFRAHLASVSPRTFSEVSKLNAQDRELYFKGLTAQAALQNARTNERYRGDQADYQRGHLGLMRDEFDAKKRGGYFTRDSGYTPSFIPAGRLDDGTQVVFDQRSGRYMDGMSGKPLSEGQVRLFQKVTGDRRIAPEDNKERLKALVELGPRPKDSKKAADWEAARDHINEVYGVKGTEPSVDDIGKAIAENLGRRERPAPAARQPDYTTPTPQQGLRPIEQGPSRAPLGFRSGYGADPFFDQWTANRPR